MTASLARPCAAAWPKTSSSRGARTCGAFHKWTANTSRAWKTSSTSTPKPPIQSAPLSALMKARPNSLARCASPSLASQVNASVTTTNISATEPSICSSSWTRIGHSARSKVTDSRSAVDFAACMRDLTDIHYPKAERIRVVLDNLSTHTAGALYEAFPPCETRRVLERLEFHYVPKHASWLNMVEIEIGVLRGQCLDRRIGTRQRLESEIAAWERLRNAAPSRIKWMFTIEKARTK